MIRNKSTYKLKRIIHAAIAAVAFSVFIIYVMVAKPNYNIMNGAAHIFLPIANGVGNVITWPVHAVGNGIKWAKETSNLRTENKRLRKKLDEMLANQNACDIAILENKKLENEINIKHASPYNTVIADILFDDAAFHHNSFLINRGKRHGLNRGMVVVSLDNRLVGTISDCGSQFCRVRALTDSDTNIAVRISGADISGFLRGNGKSAADIGFFSDTQFIARPGLKVITSNISGILPSGIYIGDTTENNRVDVLRPNNISRVMVLQYNDMDSYQ